MIIYYNNDYFKTIVFKIYSNEIIIIISSMKYEHYINFPCIKYRAIFLSESLIIMRWDDFYLEAGLN